jgi:hypothetical protein
LRDSGKEAVATSDIFIMNAQAQSIPTEFNPETPFLLPLRKASDELPRAEEECIPRLVVLSKKHNPVASGILWSALND